MASKADMKLSIVTFYQLHSNMFVQCGIKALTFWKWIDSFTTYEDYKKIHTFWKKLEPDIEQLQKTWNLLPGGETAWRVLQGTSPNDRICKLLKDAKSMALISWRQRPKRKRKSE